MKRIYKDLKEKKHFAHLRYKGRKGKIWNIWRHMKERCLYPKSPSYKNYGGRGIKVCEDWTLFENFKKDMLSSYKEGYSLDRIDNDKGYYKENCKWSTKKEQQNNTRFNRIIEYKNMKKTLTQWSEYFKIPKSTLKGRLDNPKWTLEQSMSTPILDKHNRRVGP